MRTSTDEVCIKESAFYKGNLLQRSANPLMRATHTASGGLPGQWKESCQ